MKRLFAILLVVAMMASLATVASAAENTMVLKTTVPGASYTLSIPATMEIPFGSEMVDMLMPKVTDYSGFEEKDLRLHISEVVPISDGTNSLRMSFMALRTGMNSGRFDLTGGRYMYCRIGDVVNPSWALDEGDAIESFETLLIYFEKEDWYKLAPGEHTGYIEFTSEVVSDDWKP